MRRPASRGPACLGVATLAAWAACAMPARADGPPDVNAKQVAGLFMQSCIQFAGDKDGLRNWARQTSLKELPRETADQFLYGLPGVVFDATNKDGKFVLVSEDGGSCSAIAETASGTSVITDLEQDLNAAKIVFKVTGEKNDAEERALKHREYLATQGDRQWLLLVSTVKDANGGQAMLTANRN
jgi:hypothetical protein